MFKSHAFTILLGYGLEEGENGKEKDIIERTLGQRRRAKVRTPGTGS